MMKYVSPNDEKLFGNNDSETIQNAISQAEKDGCRQVLIPRYNLRTGKNEWRIPVSIKLPSNFTIILDNCYMVQETGVYDNMFTNLYAWDMDKCTKMEYEQENISIIGRGNVILDGGEHNHLVEKTSGKYNQPPLRRNNMFFWANVNGIRLENLHIENQRWWAINHMFCRNVKINDIDFFAIPHVANMDGIDMRIGCNNFDIQNITGRTGDDVVAMTALQSETELAYKVDDKDCDIHDIKIRNIKADPYSLFCVRILNHDGSNIYNIDIDTIMDVSDYTRKALSGGCIIIGSNIYYNKRPAEHGETRNITAKNITSRSRDALNVIRTVVNSKFSNIKTYGDNVNGISIGGPCSLENVTFEHLWYGALQQEIYVGKMLEPKNYRGTVLNLLSVTGDVAFKDINADAVRQGILLRGDAKVTVDGFKCNSVLHKLSISPESNLILNEEE